jgi:putative transposase
VSQVIHKSHNVSVLLYHFVCPTKYRRAILTAEVDTVLSAVCQEIENRYEIDFIEIGADKDHVHFLVQSVPTLSPTKIITCIKSITAREIRRQVPSVKKQLWGGAFWSSGFYVNTVGRYGDENTIRQYVARQGKEKEFEPIYARQLELFQAEPAELD